MRIAVFGARGFIGGAFVRAASSNHELFLFNRPDADVRNPKTFSERLKKVRPDVVVNLSASLGTMLTSQPMREVFETNTMGSLHVAHAAKEAGARAYIFISSTVVHGQNKTGEHHGRFSGFAPKHPYSASKAAAEFALQTFAKEDGGMIIVTLRPPMVIGEGSRLELPPIEFVREIQGGRAIKIFGDGLHEREFVSVEDVAFGIREALAWSMGAENGYHPFFLTGNRSSMRNLAEQAVKKFGGMVAYVPSSKQAFSLTTDPVDSMLFEWQVRDDLDAILDEVWRFVSLEKKVS